MRAAGLVAAGDGTRDPEAGTTAGGTMSRDAPGPLADQNVGPCRSVRGTGSDDAPCMKGPGPHASQTGSADRALRQPSPQDRARSSHPIFARRRLHSAHASRAVDELQPCRRGSCPTTVKQSALLPGFWLHAASVRQGRAGRGTEPLRRVVFVLAAMRLTTYPPRSPSGSAVTTERTRGAGTPIALVDVSAAEPR